jgi:hypothetical protein
VTTSTRDPFREDPAPPFVEVDEVDLETAWEGEQDDRVVCPECDSGRVAERGASDERRWVSFAPCGHVVVLADWAVA